MHLERGFAADRESYESNKFSVRLHSNIKKTKEMVSSENFGKQKNQ
jgi:hypothetical protein